MTVGALSQGSRDVEPVAYLCVGDPVDLPDIPTLEQTGWRARKPLERALHDERDSSGESPVH
jgi:hypothetical protein